MSLQGQSVLTNDLNELSEYALKSQSILITVPAYLCPNTNGLVGKEGKILLRAGILMKVSSSAWNKLEKIFSINDNFYMFICLLNFIYLILYFHMFIYIDVNVIVSLEETQVRKCFTFRTKSYCSVSWE